MSFRFYAEQMRIKSLDELREVDELSARFTPLGFSTTRVMTPESAAGSHQESIASADLVEAVADDTTRTFDRLREVHTYGVLLYDLYSCVEQLQPFVLEQALRDRFVTFYDGLIPFMAKDGTPTPLKAKTFDEVFEAVGKGNGSHAKTRSLEVHGNRVSFRGYLRDLIAWARAAGLLRGERNRYRERIWIEIRNHFAHPSGHSVSGPVESARAIRRLGEVINHLWGSETVDGELYPTPFERGILAIGWPMDGTSIMTLHADQLAGQPNKEDWQYVILRAYRDDGALPTFDTCFELTNLPAELLWGPGLHNDAVNWIERSNPEPDFVRFLDRLFAIRIEDEHCDLPRRVEVAAGLESADRSGIWHLVRADIPADALSHTRSVLLDETECASDPAGCSNCPATTLRVGPLDALLAYHHSRFGPVTTDVPRRVRTQTPWTPA